MSHESLHPTLDELLAEIGDAGLRLAELRAAEGAAGNISVFVGWDVDTTAVFPQVETIELPLAAPELAGKHIIVSGSGQRLRTIHRDPVAHVGVVTIDAGGRTGQLHTAPRRRFTRVSSEFNSHLAVHREQAARTGADFGVLVHAQPSHITYLSHIAQYRDERFFNRQLYRWEPEMIMLLPEGIGVLPFEVPGSAALMDATVAGLRAHRLVVWSKHGVVAHSIQSAAYAVDLIEYAEAAAQLEYMDLAAARPAEGLADAELRAIANTQGIKNP